MSTRTIPAESFQRLETPSRRINPDSIHTLWVTVGIVAVLAVVSFMVSFAGLSEVARWVGVPEWMAWSVPTFIDLAIVAYTLAVLIHRSRGERTSASWCSLGVFTAVSVIANAAHALSISHAVEWQAWIGAGIAAMAPLAVLAATEELGRLAVAPVAHSLAGTVLVPEGATQMHEALQAITASARPELPTSHAPQSDTRDAPTSEVASEMVTAFRVDSPRISVSLPPGIEATPIEPTAATSPAERIAQKTPLDEPVFESLISPADQETSRIAKWVAGEEEAGREPNGSALARHLNVSDRTGRRKLKSFNEARGGSV